MQEERESPVATHDHDSSAHRELHNPPTLVRLPPAERATSCRRLESTYGEQFSW